MTKVTIAVLLEMPDATFVESMAYVQQLTDTARMAVQEQMNRDNAGHPGNDMVLIGSGFDNVRSKD